MTELEKQMVDEDGLFVYTDNYSQTKSIMNERMRKIAEDKLERIPIWIRKIFNAY